MTKPDPLADAASEVVERYWKACAAGRPVTVDELLQTADTAVDALQLRATVMRTIAAQTAAYADRASEPAASDASVLWHAMRGSGPMPDVAGYDLVRSLGRGGMGAVFEAYQKSTGRRVAIKFMLDAVGAAESARKRFEREVEVVARLQHPSIVSVIDSGVRSGQYFYVMEFVEGRNLDTMMVPGACPVRDAVSIMAMICDAVDYAHQHGVLHRDLKPGNVLVDAQMMPHLLDFGLAKVFDPETNDGGSHGQLGLTVSGPGQLLGTVAYMSPEQAAGRHEETNVRTDVYALGVIAYELITGRLPVLTEGSLQEVLTGIMTSDPPPPSALRAGVTRDLDAVLLKALEKSPARRYATAGECAADLRRALAGEPVLARRISAAGRAWRWVGRNRAVSAVSAGALLTLLVVSTILIAQIVRESSIAAAERDLAQANFDRLRMILESADPERSPGGATVLQLLDTATHALDESPPDNLRAEAEIREVLGSVYRKLGEYAKAIDHQSRVLQIREKIAGRRVDPLVAEALHNLAATLWWDGSFARAEDLYIRSLEMRRTLHRGDHPSVAFSLTHLAACRLRMGKQEDARRMYEEALAMRRRLYGSEHEEIAQSLNNLAKCLLESGALSEAEALHREALEMIRRVRGDRFIGTAAASQNLGECLLRRAEAEEAAGRSSHDSEALRGARDAFATALDIREATFPSGHHLIAASISGLARVELRLGNIERAEELARKSIEELTRTRRSDHPDFVAGLSSRAKVEMARSRHADAVATLEHAVRIAAAVRPRDEVLLAELYGHLGLALALSGAYDRSEEMLAASLDQLRHWRGAEAPETVIAHRRMVALFDLQDEPRRAAHFEPGARASVWDRRTISGVDVGSARRSLR